MSATNLNQDRATSEKDVANRDPSTPTACCGAPARATCCSPSDKQACCGGKATPSSCGCR